jgi:hypothetical protein
MANTWTLLSQGVTLFTVDYIANGLYNGSATHTLKIRRVGFVNVVTANPLPAANQVLEIRHYTGVSDYAGETAITPIAHDTTNGALDACQGGYAGAFTDGTGTVLRYINWNGQAPSASQGRPRDWQCLVPWNIVWEASYGNSDLQSLTLNEDEAYCTYVKINASAATAVIDIWAEFTDES